MPNCDKLFYRRMQKDKGTLVSFAGHASQPFLNLGQCAFRPEQPPQRACANRSA